jgi:hypothetical protein
MSTEKGESVCKWCGRKSEVVDMGSCPFCETPRPSESVEEIVNEFWTKFDDGKTPQMVAMMDWLRTTLTSAPTESVEKVVEEILNHPRLSYFDQGAKFAVELAAEEILKKYINP